ATFWSLALLSVDANVLLDRYRYHGEVRTQILDALRYFEGRLWLTNQAAEEFIRNRTAVISKTSAEYDSANKLLKEFDKSLTHLRDALRGNRLVPDTVPAELEQATRDAIQKAEKAVQDAKLTHPNFLANDPILDELLALFENAVGDPPTNDQQKQLKDEAK